MTVLPELKIKLDLLGTLGTLVIGTTPASPDVIGVLKEYGGRAPERRFGVVGVGYEHPSVQIIFRGAPFDYKGPRDKAEIAWKSLMAVQPSALCAGVNTVYLMIDPQQSPFQIQQDDENNRRYIGFNAYIKKEPS